MGATPAELGPSRFRGDPLGVVAGDDEHLGGDVGARPKAADSCGADAVVSSARTSSWAVILSLSRTQHRAIERSVWYRPRRWWWSPDVGRTAVNQRHLRQG